MNSRARSIRQPLVQRGMGQFVPGGSPYGFYPPQRLDPTLDLALSTLSEVLRRSGDEKAPASVYQIRRIIIGRPTAPTAGPQQPRRLSDLEPMLTRVADFRENPWPYYIAAAAIPLVAFLLGRRMGQTQTEPVA